MSRLIDLVGILIAMVAMVVFFVAILVAWTVGSVVWVMALAFIGVGEWLIDKLEDLRDVSSKCGNFWDRILWRKLGLFQKGTDLN